MIEAGTVKLSLFGSGDAYVDQGAREARVSLETSGSGDISVEGLEAKEASVSVCGSGDISAHAGNRAEIVVMGSGDVSITGGAKCTVSGSGSGDVRCS